VEDGGLLVHAFGGGELSVLASYSAVIGSVDELITSFRVGLLPVSLVIGW